MFTTASDLMYASSFSTRTMLEMSSGRRPLRCNNLFPASLCKAANLQANKDHENVAAEKVRSLTVV
jgi:hypothetical protein